MALPAGFLDELKTRLSLAQVAGRKVTWDTRKSNPGKGDYWAPCPFHQEKTASFHVEDAKGFYYCFGCHAKGDALSFVRETENVDFMEAVKILAAEAGMTVPAQDPRAAESAKKRATLYDVMEAAVQFYRMQLNSAQAGAAREYISGRGLTEEHIGTFEIGFAPSSRTALLEHLKKKDITIEQMDEAGLVIVPDSGTPFDRFRDRIIFPIRDGRGRAIAFGGRAMSPDAKAKYLNSPETALFDKGNALYNHQPAREAAGKAGSLIVAEGYMDVIALATHGFTHSVAPLGTAITQGQLQLMWRIADEPVIALDGDKAGLRAAMRLIDVALPILTAGKSLRFALMPEGLDPDDLLRNSGPSAMQKLLDDALPLASLLWRRETEDKVFDSPERRAALDANLKRLLSEIKDPSIQAHYRADFRQRRSALFAPPPRQMAQKGATGYGRTNARRPSGPSASTKSSLLARSADSEARIRESIILRTCLMHPALIEAFESEIETLPFMSTDLGRVRDVLLDANTQLVAENDDKNSLQERLLARMKITLSEDQINPVMVIGNSRGNAHISTEELAKDMLRADISRHRAIVGQMKETQEAEMEISAIEDEGMMWRLQEANRAKDNAARMGFDDNDDSSEEDAQKSQFLQQLIDEQSWIKKKG